jgi:zinc transporter
MDSRRRASEPATSRREVLHCHQRHSGLVERVKQLQEELAAFVNEQTNRTLFVLTVVTVLALPINLVAGLFGMNVGGIPLAQHPYGFFFVVSPLLVLTAFLAYWGLGRRRD